jgi:hypothetical protein
MHLCFQDGGKIPKLNKKMVKFGGKTIAYTVLINFKRKFNALIP